MAIKRRPPVYIEKRKTFSGRAYRVWVCDTRLRAAEFQDRQRPERFAVVHMSTKKTDRWQTSYFDDRGASSDILSPSCREALRELPPSRWRLRKLSPAR